LISPISSANTTPSSSPPNPSYFGQQHNASYSINLTVQEQPEEEEGESTAPRLGRIQPDTLKCSTCATDLAFATQIVSKGFTGRYGRAYLVSPPPARTSWQAEKDKGKNRDLINTKVGRPQNRQLVTGAHVVADISCVVCESVVGWKYVDAKESAQRYKIGKFILETRKVVGGKTWEDAEGSDIDVAVPGTGDGQYIGKKEGNDEGEIEFNSEDEDECEDLFAGVWDPEVVKKRRERRVGRMKAEESPWGLV
jgi:hypothetical protein